ncbi:MAG: hypothetical protein AAF745_05815 [Planctomycetota bacterium]
MISVDREKRVMESIEHPDSTDGLMKWLNYCIDNDCFDFNQTPGKMHAAFADGRLFA